MTTRVKTALTSPRPLAMLAGTLFAATAAVDIPHEQAQPFASGLDYLLEVLFCLSLTTSALTAWALSRHAPGKAVLAAWRCFAGGAAVLGVVTASTAVAGHDVLGPGFLLGGLALLVGAVVLLVLDVRRRVSPRGAGMLAFGAVVAMVALGDGYGLLPWAAVWFAMSALLAPVGARQAPVPAAR
ncbi:MAG: hypothetical protein ACTHKG_05870 [Nocardioides sp.]